ncbi:MAG: hypothetical protein MJK08_04000 [Campylobacterales bacterium]|nr:hypothetical protein [Campylobacterales bacterium]
MSLKCEDIGKLRAVLDNGSTKVKPNGQKVHKIGECTVSTYDTGAVVIQDNSKAKETEAVINSLVQSINALA